MSATAVARIARGTHQYNGLAETSGQLRSDRQLLDRTSSLTSRCISAKPEGVAT